MAYFYAKISLFAAEIFLCILIATQVFAGTDAESNREIKQEVVVVIAGGFGSCPDDLIFDRAIRAGKSADMQRLFAMYVLPVLKRKQFADRPTIFSLCYSGPDSLASSLTQSISGRYAWNRDDLKRNAEGVKTFSVSQGKSLNELRFLEPVTMELKNYLQSRKDLGLKVRLYLIGHSYGGFTALQLADFLADDLVGLVTLDPISMLSCQAKEMATKVYSTIALKHDGCKLAPNDVFSLKSIDRILHVIEQAKGTVWWYHIYQKAFPWLHSDAVMSASGSAPLEEQVVAKDFRSPIVAGDFHSQLARHGAVWNKIAAQFDR
jgi:hypothetical protein